MATTLVERDHFRIPGWPGDTGVADMPRVRSLLLALAFTGCAVAESDVATELPAPGLPFSLVFRAEPGKEDVLLHVASSYEAASRRRVPPPAFAGLPSREPAS